MNNKVKLGIFVVIGLLAIFVSIIAVGSFSFGKKYKVYVLFNNTSGLLKKAKVKIAGVDIGVLKGIDLHGSKARLCLSIDEDIVLYENAEASIVSMGIIGTKYIEIYPGDPSLPRVKNGDTISKSETGSLEETLGKISDKINTALDSIGRDGKNGDMIDNLSASIRDLKSVMNNIANQNAKIASAIGNIDKFAYNINEFAANLADITVQNKQDIRDAVAGMKEMVNKMDALIAKVYNGDGPIGTLINDEDMSRELKETVTTAKETLASAKITVESLQETIGKASKLRLSWNYLGRYNLKDEKMRNDLGISIMPSDDKFYYVGITNVAEAGEVKDQDEKDSINKLEALLGFRFDKFEVYGGVLRGKAGGGVGFSFFDPIYAPYKRLQVNFNAYNFGRDKRGPEMDLGLRLGFTKWLYAGVMVEDVLYKTAVTPYLKIEINDSDLAALLGIISVAAIASR
ncbi:MAG: MlaD family protein [Endomicrobia bacterium]|nr:MlaD family protein [Endomicrobiia bacterium]